VHALHVTVPNAAVGMAIFYGGLCQFIAGMWEFASGNTFGATGESQGLLHRLGCLRGTHVVLLRSASPTSIPQGPEWLL
jgi:hypothetical protein